MVRMMIMITGWMKIQAEVMKQGWMKSITIMMTMEFMKMQRIPELILTDGILHGKVLLRIVFQQVLFSAHSILGIHLSKFLMKITMGDLMRE